MKMNRFVLCALTCVFSWTLICAADESETENYAKEFYFRDGVSWGYDEEWVKSIEGDRDYSEERIGTGLSHSLVYQDITAAGAENVVLVYTFVGDCLLEAVYDFPAGSVSFDQLYGGLCSVYGPSDDNASVDRASAVKKSLYGESGDVEAKQYAAWELEDGTFISLAETQETLEIAYCDEAAVYASVPEIPEGLEWEMDPDQAVEAAGYNYWSMLSSGDDSGMAYLTADDRKYRGLRCVPALLMKDDALIMITREFDEDEYHLSGEELAGIYTELYGQPASTDTGQLEEIMSMFFGAGLDEEKKQDASCYCLNWDLGDGTTLTLTNMCEDDDAGLIMYNKDIIAKNMAPAEEPETFNSEGL